VGGWEWVVARGEGVEAEAQELSSRGALPETEGTVTEGTKTESTVTEGTEAVEDSCRRKEPGLVLRL